MTAVADGAVYDGPGIYPLMPETVYHADPVPGGSLSHSGARRLLTGTPALFKWERDHGGRPDTDAFDFGRAAHAKVLGVGGDVVIVQVTAKDGTKSDAADYRTNSAKEHRDEIRAAGMTPLLAADAAHVNAMAEQLKTHRLASTLLATGTAEVSAFWTDPDSGIVRRCRFDYSRPNRSGRVVVVDYKSTVSADPVRFAKSCGDYGYHSQHAWYVDGAIAAGLDDDPGFVFVAQEKTPPYLVNVVQLEAVDVQVGRRENRTAVTRYARCAATGQWPGYPADQITTVGLPAYYQEKTA